LGGSKIPLAYRHKEICHKRGHYDKEQHLQNQHAVESRQHHIPMVEYRYRKRNKECEKEHPLHQRKGGMAGYEVRLLTAENIWNYVTLPEHIVCKYKDGIRDSEIFEDGTRVRYYYTDDGHLKKHFVTERNF